MTKNDSEAIVNVNLRACTCPAGWPAEDGSHFPRFSETLGCDAAPVLVPLPLEPWRSVPMTVALTPEVECTTPIRCTVPTRGPVWAHTQHGHWCPARPVEVTCSIGGKDWASSEVIDAHIPRPEGGFIFTAFPGDLAPLRARWALVKALVTGDGADGWMLSEAWAEKWNYVAPLFAQRDAVYADITELFRVEQAAAEIRQRALKHLGALNTWIDYGCSSGHPAEVDGRRVSVVLLAHYVGKLVEQVGALS